MSSRSPMLCCDEPWPEPIRTRYRKCSYRLANTVQDGAGKARSKHVRASRIALIPQQHAATNHLIAPVNSQCEKCGLTATEIAARLELKRYRRSWRGRCPVCNYAGNTFSLREFRKKLGIYCANGCDRDQLASAL